MIWTNVTLSGFNIAIHAILKFLKPWT